MLVEDWAIQLGPIQYRAGIAHRLGQCDRFRARHTLEEGRHGEGGDLPFGDGAFGQAIDHERDLGLLQRLAVAFLADDFLGEHALFSSRSRPRRSSPLAQLHARSRRYRLMMRASLAAPSGASSFVSSWVISAPVMPAAKFTSAEAAAQRRPKKRPRMISGT